MSAKSLQGNNEMSDKLPAKTLYLANEGTREIFKHVPTNIKVWLYQNEGVWTYTFSQAIAGTAEDGVSIPTVYLKGGKIAQEHEDEVIAFLCQLGLSTDDARFVFSRNRMD